MSRRAWLALAVVALSGCGGASIPDLAGRHGLPDASWVNISFVAYDGVAAAAGLRPLRDVRLADGEREVRVWLGTGLGYPQNMFRLSEREDTVGGELIRYWPVTRDFPPGRVDTSLHRSMMEFDEGRCRGFTYENGYGVCRALFTRSPDWPAALKEAEAAGLWTLPDPSTLPPPREMTIDGSGLVVELRTDSTYRAYRYHFPVAQRSWPEGEQAATIFQTFSSLLQQMPPRDPQARQP